MNQQNKENTDEIEIDLGEIFGLLLHIFQNIGNVTVKRTAKLIKRFGFNVFVVF